MYIPHYDISQTCQYKPYQQQPQTQNLHQNQDYFFREDENQEGSLKLFIGGLNYLSMQDDIKSYFETFGKVSTCYLPKDNKTGKSRCFAFIIIEDPESKWAHKILSQKFHEINGKIVDVKRAEQWDCLKKIFVGGWEPSVNKYDLLNFFSKFGPVMDASVWFDYNRGTSRCFGFVIFERKETVEWLLKRNDYVIKGKMVDVKLAEEKSGQNRKNIQCQNNVDILLNKYK